MDGGAADSAFPESRRKDQSSMPSIEDLPRAVWGVQPEAVEEHLSELLARCETAESELATWRQRAMRAEAELQRVASTTTPTVEGSMAHTKREASLILQKAEVEARTRRARWEKDLREAEEELAATRAQIDGLRKDFHALLEGVSNAVAQRGTQRP